MKTINPLSEYQPSTPLALSIGMFDGVHLGHQSLIKRLNTIAKEKNLKSAILSFWPHPKLVFQPQSDLQLLNTLDEKKALLESFGMDYFLLQDFTEAFRNLSAEDFIEQILVRQLQVKHLIVGYDHRFGKNQTGNFELLKALAPRLGFEVEQQEAIALENQNISSTKIRNALLAGDILQANAMLGYPYSISGAVIHGKKIGRTIGYPTANIEVPPHQLLPKKGAYIVEVLVQGQLYKGMLSVGTNPTVNGTQMSVEVYILDFDASIYGETITVKFRDFLHEEIKFDGLENLIKKLDDDKIRTQNFKF
ncbi:bifunctional riboflavin kinase/FAD synthetase [Riemerella columbina]|uniref:bifunctional riboflavin kinase/FAD synthetase n=1 Tax=Riemerella columbina TaxID=103810 RepID=UPI00266FD267|nr:bifunctional riboflavin kinase/FAD synthetase [Riemerella columbina]WKS96059.1 bifunctional riboflavin kinase/FAD synthetase [Riemerella columbina]